MRKTFICFFFVPILIHAQGYQKSLEGNVITFNVINLGKLARPGNNNSVNALPCAPALVSANYGLWQIFSDTVLNGKTYKRVYYDSLAYWLANGGERSVNINGADTCDYSTFCCQADEKGNDLEKGFVVFPNPATDILYCKLETVNESGIEISLMNSLGEVKKVMQRNVKTGRMNLK